ncbi:hypothetical protein LUZ60_004667 [Juncus effusus]|nr:hypothetical protein LUZ60_004667 [Juncus effusus]
MGFVSLFSNLVGHYLTTIMARRWRPTAKSDFASAEQIVILSSSDDEAANEDLSLAVVEKAKRKAYQEIRKEEPQEISKEEPQEISKEKEKSNGKTKLKKKKKKTKKEFAENEAPATISPDEERNSTATESVPSEATEEIPDNIVLRRLLRGPRYFDKGEARVDTCFKCGEEGHMAVNCKAEKREKPCFVCGLFGHNGKRCTQGCHICKKKGHIAKYCPEKNKKVSQDSKVCLKCGDLGHDMISCVNDYPTEDMQEIECYVCKKKGHLCCADLADSYPKEVSCYNCAQSGHYGDGCAKPKGDVGTVLAMTMCYRCGEEGHFARGCPKSTKYDRSKGDFSSSRRRPCKEHDEKLGFRSAPNHHANKGSKRKSDKRGDIFSTPKSRNKGGWIVDDPGDFPASSSSPKKKFKSYTKGHMEKSHRGSGFRGDYSYSTPHNNSHNYNNSHSYGQGVSYRRHKRFESPDSSTYRGQRWNDGYSGSRFSNSHERFDWD